MRPGQAVVSCRANLQLPTSLTSRRGRYSCGLDLCLSPTRSLDVEGLQTAQHRGTRSGRSRQGVDSAWKDAGNCKPGKGGVRGIIEVVYPQHELAAGLRVAQGAGEPGELLGERLAVGSVITWADESLA